MSEYLNVTEAAARLRVAKRTIWRLVDRGKLPARHISCRIVRFLDADIDRMMGVEVEEKSSRQNDDLKTHPREPRTYPPCQHCKSRPATRPRGLCWSCWCDPEVRDLHPSTSIHARRGVSQGGGALPEPTNALAGTPEKVEVLAARAAAGLSLWHPADPSQGRAPTAWRVPTGTLPPEWLRD